MKGNQEVFDDWREALAIAATEVDDLERSLATLSHGVYDISRAIRGLDAMHVGANMFDQSTLETLTRMTKDFEKMVGKNMKDIESKIESLSNDLYSFQRDVSGYEGRRSAW